MAAECGCFCLGSHCSRWALGGRLAGWRRRPGQSGSSFCIDVRLCPYAGLARMDNCARWAIARPASPRRAPLPVKIRQVLSLRPDGDINSVQRVINNTALLFISSCPAGQFRISAYKCANRPAECISTKNEELKERKKNEAGKLLRTEQTNRATLPSSHYRVTRDRLHHHQHHHHILAPRRLGTTLHLYSSRQPFR